MSSHGNEVSGWLCNFCTYCNHSPDGVLCEICGNARSPTNSEEGWTCLSCTFSNLLSKRDCEVCGNPKSDTKQEGGVPIRLIPSSSSSSTTGPMCGPSRPHDGFRFSFLATDRKIRSHTSCR
jgi:hypothetical protein